MLLLDHFHQPLHPLHPWESFHSGWAWEIMSWLNRHLPRRFLATVNTHLGPMVQADVAEFDHLSRAEDDTTNGPANGGGGVAVQTWAPPVAAATMPAIFPDDLEIRVLDRERDARIAGVVELVSPANKDEPETRLAFAAKCAAYLQRGLGLVTIDIVTNCHFNLHNELVSLLGLGDPFLMAENATIYVVAYRPTRREDKDLIDLWPMPLKIGEPLPVAPFALRGWRTVPLDLDDSYTETCNRSRL